MKPGAIGPKRKCQRPRRLLWKPSPLIILGTALISVWTMPVGPELVEGAPPGSELCGCEESSRCRSEWLLWPPNVVSAAPNSPSPGGEDGWRRRLRPSGGYRTLRDFQVSTLIYDGTVAFCA